MVTWLTNLRPTVRSFPLPLPSLSPSVLRLTGIYSYLKLHGKEKGRKKDLRSHLEIELGTLRTEGRVLTNCVDPCS